MKLLYAHGINTIESSASGLKSDWDKILFGKDNPESAIAYWGDLSIVQQRMALTFEDKVLCEIFKIATGNHLLQDCNSYFYNMLIRAEIQKRLINILPRDGEPFVLLSHSLGTVIAYEVLLQMQTTLPELNCVQLITIGSPLGINGVQSEIRRSQNIIGPLPIPKSVAKWSNYSDLFDPVALDHFLNDSFEDGFLIQDHIVNNPYSPQKPHAIVGYLALPLVRDRVLSALNYPLA